jgi:aminocarboxymuconate-semialdehyde decarboxylase
MDRDGIDLQAMSINAYWYGAERDLARRLIDRQNEGLAKPPPRGPTRPPRGAVNMNGRPGGNDAT